MPTVAEFEPIADALREEVRDFFEVRGQTLDGPEGLNTLETNSGFVERRGHPLVELYFRRSGRRSIHGLRLLDVGCGLGSLAIFFASRGATVTAIDPNGERLRVGRSVAARYGLPVSFLQGHAEQLDLEPGSFDLALMNNSLCYIVARSHRERALEQARRALRPGGWLLVRNPNRLHPIDQFTGIPFVQFLAPHTAVRVAGLLGRSRSNVRVCGPGAARRELVKVGFEDVQHDTTSGGGVRKSLGRIARYQHLSASTPQPEDPGPPFLRASSVPDLDISPKDPQPSKAGADGGRDPLRRLRRKRARGGPGARKVLLVCGTTASGKTFLTERLLAVDYDVSTQKMDSIYRDALDSAGVPPPEGRPHSVAKAARGLRAGAFDDGTVDRFLARFDELVSRYVRRARKWGVTIVFEGYTLGFPDEAERIARIARSVGKREVEVARVHMKPTIEDWNRNRGDKRRKFGSEMRDAGSDAYDKEMASPEPVAGVSDHTVADLDAMRELADGPLGIRKHRWYQRAQLGPVQTPGPSNAAEKVNAVLGEDVKGKHVLDVCCATGIHAALIKNRGAARVMGVERDPIRFCKALELRKTLIRHTDIDAKVEYRQGDALDVVPAQGEFDTVVCFGALHYFADYTEILGILARAATRAAYLEFCFAEDGNDTADAPGEIRAYTRPKTGTTIYMGDPATIEATIVASMPGFEIEERTATSPPAESARREVWRLRRTS